MPFVNDLERDIHFKKHGLKVGAADSLAYERMADSFMFDSLTLTMRECLRANNTDRLRYNDSNRRFGVACRVPEYVKTFYLVPMHTVNHHGGHPGYFAHECARTDL